MSKPLSRFAREPHPDFFRVLTKRVRAHFKTEEIKHHGNSAMIVKTIVMLLIYFVPYALMFTGWLNHPLLIFAAWAVMGLGLSGIGLSVMHDANHGAYSSNKKVNKVLGLLLNIIGGDAENWKIQHNKLHHSFTNVDGLDEDINTPFFLRFSPHDKYLKMHKFQYIYAWFFYGLMTISWITHRDYSLLIKFTREGHIDKRNVTKEAIRITIWKVVYYAYMLVIPLMLMPVAPWITIVGFLIMHYVASIILACIFQPAHVIPDATFPVPNESNTIETNWAIHQLHTTANFAPKSRIFSWFVGGLNFQVEHHLFPDICHVHYKKICKIVEETAKEYKQPYHSAPTFMHAIINHGKLLKQLGRA